ncbi:MAG TPA: hypothetical protein VJ302_35975, partial [Blastocatellia bacterium]|nr:hypothetical protein [Blastocatellia bacterium]
MIDIIVSALKSIIDLLLKREEHQTRRIDTKLKERQLAEKNSLIQRASLEDVEKYDPKIKELKERITTEVKVKINKFEVRRMILVIIIGLL